MTAAGGAEHRRSNAVLGAAIVILAFLLAAYRTNPAKYSQALALAGPTADTAWLRMWVNTFGLDHYYKFNLAHIGMDTYFRLETDASRWQSMRRAYAVMERVVGSDLKALIDASLRERGAALPWTSLVPLLRDLAAGDAVPPHRVGAEFVRLVTGARGERREQSDRGDGENAHSTMVPHGFASFRHRVRAAPWPLMDCDGRSEPWISV